MTLSPALRNELFRYRKRSHGQMGGSIPGVASTHGGMFTSGLAADAHIDQAPRHFDLYDPFNPMYESSQPDYRLPEPWFADGGVQPPMPERIAGPQHDPVPPHVSEATLQLIEINQAAASVKEDALNDTTLDQNVWAPHTTVEEHPWFDPAPMSQEMFDATMEVAPQAQEPMPEHADPHAAMQAAFDQQSAQGLEALVEQMQDPFEMQRMMYEQQLLQMQQMQQVFDPFMMPGFGPGL